MMPARWLIRHLDIVFLSFATLLLVVVFAVAQPGWLTTATFQLLLADNAPLAIVSVAMTFSIISGNIDLSPGSLLALAGMVLGMVAQHHGVVQGILAALALLVVVAVFNATLIARLGLSSIVVTLAAYIWASGLAVGISHAESYNINSGLVADMNNTAVFGFTLPVIIAVITFIAGWLLLTRTRTGRYTFAVGGDGAGARRAGINVARQTLVVFGIMGIAIAAATVVLTCQLGTAQPLSGQGMELDAIVAVVIGGTRLTGGQGTIPGTAIGVLFVAILNSGLADLGLSDSYSQLWEGATLLTVLTMQVGLRRWLIPALAEWSARKATRVGTRLSESRA